MARQIQVLVRKLPPNPKTETDWQMFARNLSNGDVKMIPVPEVGDPFKRVIWELLPGAWIGPEWELDYDTNARRYTVEV